MFDSDMPGSVPGDPPPVPLERLEAQICELAGHLAAATCRFLVLLGDFDARRGWASWDMSSCAAWLDLDYAIWACFANARTAAERQAGQDRQAAREPVQVYEPDGWDDRMRQYYAGHPRGWGQVILPIPV